MLRPQFQVSRHGGVQAVGAGVLLPHAQLRLNVDAPHTVERDQVELAHALVVLGRVARCHNDPPGGHGLIAEGLALQKLQHRGGERFADTVDLVDEQDAVLLAGALHGGVNAGDDLAHRVLGHAAGLSGVVALPDKGQADGALPRVVGDGVGHQRNAALLGDLLHDLRFADARRAHQQDGALAYRRDQRRTGVIAGQVRPHGLFDFLFGTLNIHGASSFRRGFMIVLFKLFGLQHQPHGPGGHLGRRGAVFQKQKRSLKRRAMGRVNALAVGKIQNALQVAQHAALAQLLHVGECGAEVGAAAPVQRKIGGIAIQRVQIRQPGLVLNGVVGLQNQDAALAEKTVLAF